MKLIVGLGNPGKDYDKTRHNVGFMVVDNYVNDANWKEKFNSLFFEMNVNGEKVLFLKPLTYMNLSGDSVIKFVNYYKIAIEDILVISDDLDLELSKFKIKKDSSAGGHNGLKSIISCLNTDSFYRIKVGISNNKNIDTKDYVLDRFSKKDLEVLESMFSDINKVIDYFILKGEEGIKKDFYDYYSKKEKREINGISS